jgi:hypothetical protein
MLDPVGSLDSAVISCVRPISESCGCEMESLPDLGGLEMLNGRCDDDGEEVVCCDEVVAAAIAPVLCTTSEAVDVAESSGDEFEDRTSTVEEEPMLDIDGDGRSRTWGVLREPCGGRNPSDTPIAARSRSRSEFPSSIAGS